MHINTGRHSWGNWTRRSPPLADEAGGGDEYGDVYSPDWPDRGSTNREEDPFPKWLGVGLLVLTVCLGISLIVHAIFQGGL